MVFPQENPKDDYFYILMWSKEITESLVTFLMTRKAVGTWSWESNNRPSVIEAREYLNSTFHLDYTDIKVLGHVKKLHSRYNLFNHMISSSGVFWDQKQNFINATTEQWKAWREVYPMSRAYTFMGEPLFAQLKALFGPEEGDDGAELILIVDSDEEGHILFHEEVVHALPAQAPVDPLLPNFVIISSDSDSDDIYDMFDTDIDLDFSTDEEREAHEEVVSELIEEVIDDFLLSNDEVTTPDINVPSFDESRFFYNAALNSMDPYYLRDGFTTSDSDSD